MQNMYSYAREKYAAIGVDTEAAIAKLSTMPISLHCWQGDDIKGFANDGELSGGIQTTGNYPGAARNPEELMADLDKAFSLMPGKQRLNVHACYPIFEKGEWVDLDALEPKHFAKWVEWAKEKGMDEIVGPLGFSDMGSAFAASLPADALITSIHICVYARSSSLSARVCSRNCSSSRRDASASIRSFARRAICASRSSFSITARLASSARRSRSRASISRRTPSRI